MYELNIDFDKMSNFEVVIAKQKILKLKESMKTNSIRDSG